MTSLWTDAQRLKELLFVFIVAIGVGFGLGVRRERVKWQGRF